MNETSQSGTDIDNDLDPSEVVTVERLQATALHPTRLVDVTAIRSTAGRRSRRATGVGLAAAVALVAGLVSLFAADDDGPVLVRTDPSPQAASPTTEDESTPTSLGEDASTSAPQDDMTATTAMPPPEPPPEQPTTDGRPDDHAPPPAPAQDEQPADPKPADIDGRVELPTFDAAGEGMPANSMAGTVRGDAGLDGGCLWVVLHIDRGEPMPGQPPTEPRYEDRVISVRWPQGTGARFYTGPDGKAAFELLDGDNNVIARDGDRITFAGYEAGHREERLPRCDVTGEAPWYIAPGRGTA